MATVEEEEEEEDEEDEEDEEEEEEAQTGLLEEATLLPYWR